VGSYRKERKGKERSSRRRRGRFSPSPSSGTKNRLNSSQQEKTEQRFDPRAKLTATVFIPEERGEKGKGVGELQGDGRVRGKGGPKR